MTGPSDEERAREIARKLIVGEYTAPMGMFEIVNALAAAKRQGFAEGVERAAEVVRAAWWPLLSDHEDVRLQLSKAIEALAPPREPGGSGAGGTGTEDTR